MARSIWKGPFTDEKILKKAQKARLSGSRSYITVYSRASVILPQHVGLNYKIHNGKKFHPFLATENTIGHRFGEFSPTRTFTGHSGDKKASRVKGGK